VSLTFLTPAAALLALGVVVPLAVFVLRRRHARRVRGRLGLGEPARRRLVVALSSLLAAAVLVGLAAAQPVLERDTTHRVRTDAEVFVVLDITRSMLAQESVSAPMRIDRAKEAASIYRASLPSVRIGLASLTDRVLPHLFPSFREDVYEATLARAMDIERPPPRTGFRTNVTALDSLGAVRNQRFYSPSAKKRLLVVVTDGESVGVSNIRLAAIMRRQPEIGTIFVHVWGGDESVFTRGAREPQYKPNRDSRQILERLADATGGTVVSEDEVSQAVRVTQGFLGEGPTAIEGERGERYALAPFLTLIAFFPLGLALWRRDR
jgi:hypothetical protein